MLICRWISNRLHMVKLPQYGSIFNGPGSLFNISDFNIQRWKMTPITPVQFLFHTTARNRHCQHLINFTQISRVVLNIFESFTIFTTSRLCRNKLVWSSVITKHWRCEDGTSCTLLNCQTFQTISSSSCQYGYNY